MSTIKVNALRHTGGSSDNINLDSSGRVLLGTSSAKAVFENASTTPQFQIESTSLNGASLSILRDGSDAGGPKLFLAHGRTDAGLVSSGDELGGIFFSGGDGSEFVSSASVTAAVDGTPGANDMPGRLVFSTAADGASSPTEAMRIDSSQNLRFNSGYGSVATAYGVRAWCNANTMSANTFNGSGNVSSITDNGSGDYTVNFTTSMPDTGYAVVAMGFEFGSTGTSDGYFTVERATNYSDSMATGSVTVRTNSGGDRNLNLIVVR